MPQILKGSPPSSYLELLPTSVRRQFEWTARLQPSHIELQGESRFSPGITMFVLIDDFDPGADVEVQFIGRSGVIAKRRKAPDVETALDLLMSDIRGKYNDARAVMVAVEDIDE